MTNPLSSTDLSLLRRLVTAHSTPGDEGEVADQLLDTWQSCGLRNRRHGRYAVSAERRIGGEGGGGLPRVLVCAHMDSPGFTVERLDGDSLRLIPLGGARFEGDSTAALLKTSTGKHLVTLRRADDDDGDARAAFTCEAVPGVRHGDRACFAGDLEIGEGGELAAPFLDNRLGCFVVAKLAECVEAAATRGVELIVGATACEEFGGFGAPVLARGVMPDAVVCVDATYEAPEQSVRIGDGPVLTLSDASVLLPPAERDRLAGIAAENGVPLQTEVYNSSGTDARAFPHAGLDTPVYALLLPTTGNHSPRETAHLDDVRHLFDLVLPLALEGVG